MKKTLLLLLSDCHVGRWTGKFNLKVVGLQLRKVGQEVVNEIERDRLRIDEVVIGLIGDIVEGENVYPAQEHFLDYVKPDLLKSVFPYLEGLKETASAHCLIQTYLAAQFIFNEIVERVAWFDVKVRVVGVVGNHGRINRHHPEANADAWCYLLLKELCKKYENVDTSELTADTFCVTTIKGQRVLFYHGHGIPIYHTLPFYGLQRRAMGWQASKVWGDLSLICIGHFHHCAFFNTCPPIVVNGAFLLDYLYPVEKLGMVSTAKQWLITLTENGIDTLKLVDLEGDLG